MSGWVKRTTVFKGSASWRAAMSRSTPPAEMEASCWSSPIRRTLAPWAMAYPMTASRSAVEAMPASSTMSRVSASMASNQVRAGSSGDGGGPLAGGLGELDEFGDGVGGGAEVLAEDFGRRRGGGKAHDGAAAVAPGGGQGGHGDGFAGAGRRERQLHAGTGGGHRADQLLLAVVEVDTVLGVLFEQGQSDAGVVGDTAAAGGRGGQDAPLGGHHLGAGVDGGVVGGVDAGGVAPP